MYAVLYGFSLITRKELEDGGVDKTDMPWAADSDVTVVKSSRPSLYMTKKSTSVVIILM